MYKYNLLERLDKLSGNDRDIFWKWAPDALFRNKETVRGWLYIKTSDPNEIGVIQLVKLAVFFGCQIEELFSEKIDKNAIVESIKNQSNVHIRNTPDTE